MLLSEKMLYFVNSSIKLDAVIAKAIEALKSDISLERMKHVAVIKKSGMYRKPNQNSPKVILFIQKSIKTSDIKKNRMNYP